jgi:3-hydroxyacyl-CoA dehydrogenase
MKAPVVLERHGRIAVLRIDNPPVNALSNVVIAALADAIDAFEVDRSYQAMLVLCEGRTFVAGADITIFDRPDFSTVPMNTALLRLERSDRLVVAVLHGTALGGGLELALSCHYRLALPETRVGLPEIKIGILPGSFGTQRVPRLAGASLALDMMLTSRMVDIETAAKAGLVDDIRCGEPLAAGLGYVNELLDARAPCVATARSSRVRRTCRRISSRRPVRGWPSSRPRIRPPQPSWKRWRRP